MAANQNPRLGILLMIASCAIFAVQDAISRHLVETANVYMVVTVRFWFFAAFVILLAARAPGGLRAAGRTAYPLLQILRGILLVGEICLIVVGFVLLGLIETHAVFVCYPLIIAALSGPLLGEKVGWRRWAAVLVGFIGVMIILQPGSAVFSPWALLPFGAAAIYALYGVLTRYVARKDAASVSFFWTGLVAAAVITPFGLLHWQAMSGPDWGWMALVCCTSVAGHWSVIKAYDLAEASALQPFGYLQLPFVSIIGLLVFNETLRLNVVVGAAIVVAAGIFTLWRQRLRERQGRA